MFDIAFSQMVAGFVGFILSWVFEYAPKVSAWFETLEKLQKAGMMFVLNVVAAFLITWGVCYGWLFQLLPGMTAPAITCAGGAWVYEVARVGIYALVINQTTHRMIRKNRK